MEIIKGIVLVLHLLSWAAVFGVAISQLTQIKKGAVKLSAGIQHAALSAFVTGLILVGLTYMMGGQPNNFKIIVKTAIVLAVLALVFVGRRRESTPAGFLGAIAGLVLVNVALAVLWH